MNVSVDDILLILKKVGVSIDVSKLKSNTSLRDSGIDSLDMANIFLEIEEKYSVNIPDNDLDSIDSIDDIVKYLLR